MEKVMHNYRHGAFALLIILIVIVGLLRISSTYSIFWQTWDEPAHIAAGMEWLDRRHYTYEPLHPPLARLMDALGPYLDGIRSIGKASMFDEGNTILQENGTYERNLTLARLGILPFFIIASVVVALWAKEYGGATTSLLSVVLFTTLPVILGHSGVAALDMACAALVTAALFALCLWLEQPTLLRSHLLGITVGLAILAKFSSLGFLIVSGGLIAVIYIFRFFRETFTKNRGQLRVRQRMIASVIALLICSLAIWAGYRFSYKPYILEAKYRPHEKIDRIVGTQGLLHDVAYSVVENVPIPAPEFFVGISQLSSRNNSEEGVYFLGKIRRTRYCWYFYPIILLLRTPIPFLLLALSGFFVALKHVITQKENLQVLTPIVAAIGVLVIGMLSSVDNGVRQVLCVYPLLAIVAGYGASRLLSLHPVRYIGLGLITILLSWQLVSSFAAHPDYLAYFNEFAVKHPETIAVDSDLDWGQDLKRLTTTLKNRGIKELAIKYNGSQEINLDQFNLPHWRELNPYQKTTGWIAMSVYHLKYGTGEVPYDQYSWLKKYQPVEKVGKSIWLYYIPGK